VPTPAFRDTAILWTRETVRCVLSTDGVRYEVSLRDGDVRVDTTRVSSAALAMNVAYVWRERDGAVAQP
jgi:hypothetical protein